MSYPVIINAKLNLLICFSLAMLDAVLDESCFFKLQHPFKSSFWSAFNWPIDEGNSFKFDTTTNQTLGVHSIGQ